MNEQALLIICMGTILIACFLLVYYIYSLVLIDAQSKGIKRPKIWALLASRGNRGEGILLYLFYRNKYNKNMSILD